VGRPQDNGVGIDNDTRRLSDSDRQAARERIGEVVGDGATMADPGGKQDVGSQATHTPNDFSAAPAEQDLAAGTRVGEYEVEESFGTPWLAFPRRLTGPLKSRFSIG